MHRRRQLRSQPKRQRKLEWGSCSIQNKDDKGDPRLDRHGDSHSRVFHTGFSHLLGKLVVQHKGVASSRLSVSSKAKLVAARFGCSKLIFRWWGGSGTGAGAVDGAGAGAGAGFLSIRVDCGNGHIGIGHGGWVGISSHGRMFIVTTKATNTDKRNKC